MNTLANHTCLSASEEFELGVRASKGDKAARDKLVTSNIRFVISYTKKYRGHGLSDEELIEEGIIGLIKAADRFVPGKGRFTTYSKFWIHNAVMSALNENGTVHISEDKMRLVVKIRKLLASEKIICSDDNSFGSVCRRAGCSLEEGRSLLALAQDSLSFDAPFSDESDDNSYSALISDEHFLSPEDECVNNDLVFHLRKAVNALKPLEYEILVRHYGLFGTKKESLEKIGFRFGRSKARIQQIEKRVIEDLKRCF